MIANTMNNLMKELFFGDKGGWGAHRQEGQYKGTKHNEVWGKFMVNYIRVRTFVSLALTSLPSVGTTSQL